MEKKILENIIVTYTLYLLVQKFNNSYRNMNYSDPNANIAQKLMHVNDKRRNYNIQVCSLPNHTYNIPNKRDTLLYFEEVK